jgi:hypothetical protein
VVSSAGDRADTRGVRRVILAASLIAAAPAPAHGHGRFPVMLDVLLQPGEPEVIGAPTTWGLIVSTDGGATWRWTCEEAVGFAGVYDPDYAFTATGLLVATTNVAGLRLTRDLCTWSEPPPELGATFVARVRVGPDGWIYAAAADPFTADTRLYVSDDDAASFTAVADPAAGVGGVDWWQSMAVVPALLPGDQTRVYLSGYTQRPGPAPGDDPITERHLLRSDDRGATWRSLPLDDLAFGGYLSELHVIATSPTDPDLVFARVGLADGVALGDTLYRSTDAGMTWTEVHASRDVVTAVVVRRSGEVVLAERGPAPTVGVRVSSDGGATFGPPIAGTVIHCLRERDDGTLLACGDGLAPVHLGIGSAQTAGDWAPIMAFRDVDGPIACPTGTVQRDVCEGKLWPYVACQLDVALPPAPCDGVVPDAGVDGGAGPPPPPQAGCGGCRAGATGATGLVALALALPLLSRRRRV